MASLRGSANTRRSTAPWPQGVVLQALRQQQAAQALTQQSLSVALYLRRRNAGPLKEIILEAVPND
jgi:hypothetical protein